jgi:sec-independent protein translocase protein TatA
VSIPLAFQWGPWEIILVLAVLLLLFGANKLPKLAKSLGASMTEFKKGLRGEPDEGEQAKLNDAEEKSKARQPD